VIDENIFLLFVFEEKNKNIINRKSKIKSILRVQNIINNTIQTIKYTSNFIDIINDINNNNFYCSSSFNNSIMNINQLFKINDFIDNNDNTYTIDVNYDLILPNLILPFEIDELIYIYKKQNNIELNVIDNIPIIISKISNINGNLITIEKIDDNFNNIKIGDIININNI
jgi:hypothetical protein